MKKGARGKPWVPFLRHSLPWLLKHSLTGLGLAIADGLIALQARSSQVGPQYLCEAAGCGGGHLKLCTGQVEAGRFLEPIPYLSSRPETDPTKESQ